MRGTAQGRISSEHKNPRTTMIILFGSNSELGNALVAGLRSRFPKSVFVAVGRSPNPNADHSFFTPDGGFPPELVEGVPESRALVLSVGEKIAEDEGMVSSNCERLFYTNVVLSIRFLEGVLEHRRRTSGQRLEVHLVSSVLAGVSRESMPCYSLTKMALERLVSFTISRSTEDISVFVWRLPYVPTGLHAYAGDFRSNHSGLKLLDLLTRMASVKEKDGLYFVPQWLRMPSMVLSRFPILARIAERLFLK